jgi:hypothetical protein
VETYRLRQIVDYSYLSTLMNASKRYKDKFKRSLATTLRLCFLTILILVFVDIGTAAALFTEEDELEGVGGRSVAIGGNRLVVSGLSPDRTTTAVYVYLYENNKWSMEQVLLGRDYSFGYSVAINSAGNRIVVGEPGFFSGYGVAHVFRLVSGPEGPDWMEEQTITGEFGPQDNRFGFSTSIVGDRIVIGAPFDDENGFDAGAVYVYQGEEIRPGQLSWSPEIKLLAPDGAPGDQFGYSVATRGGRIVAGAILNFNGTTGTHSGSVYVFNREWGSWWPETKLTPLDGMNGDLFGDSVSISGDPISGVDRIVVGTGFAVSAYVFRHYSNWAQEQKLGPFDEKLNIPCCPEDRSAVAISGKRIVVGARRSITDSQWAVHLFEFDGGRWTPEQILTDTDTPYFSLRFGRSVAILDDGIDVRVVVGEPVSDAAHIFRFVPDSDNDGVPDGQDQCPVADLTPTVMVDSCDSGVANAIVPEPAGCTINQVITDLAADASSHGQFVSEVDKLLLQLQKAEIIDSNEKNAIKDCAAQSSLP